MRFFTSNCFSHLFFLVWEAFKNKTTSSGKIFEIKKRIEFPAGNKKKRVEGRGCLLCEGSKMSRQSDYPFSISGNFTSHADCTAAAGEMDLTIDRKYPPVRTYVLKVCILSVCVCDVAFEKGNFPSASGVDVDNEEGTKRERKTTTKKQCTQRYISAEIARKLLHVKHQHLDNVYKRSKPNHSKMALP